MGTVQQGAGSAPIDCAPSTQRRVRVALWLTQLYSAEADDRLYAWPRSEEGVAEAGAFMDAADAMYAFAKTLAGGELPEGAWRAAKDSFGCPDGGAL